MARTRESQSAPRAQASRGRPRADRSRGSRSSAVPDTVDETVADNVTRAEGVRNDAATVDAAKAKAVSDEVAGVEPEMPESESMEHEPSESLRSDAGRAHAGRPEVGRQQAHGRTGEAVAAGVELGAGRMLDRVLRALRLRGPGTANRQRVALVGLGVLLLLLLLWWAFRTPEVVETMTVRRTRVENTVSALGTLQPQRYVDVGAQVSGQISRIAVRPGDVVAKGDLLAEFDPSIQQAEVDTDRATLESLRAQLTEQQAQVTLAQQKVNRQRRMAADGSTRMEDFQTAEANLKMAQARAQSLTAQIQGAASRLKGSEAKLGHTRIYAPMSGTVVTLDAREGQTLNAAYQTPVVMRIADLSRMTVWAEVSEADIGRVKRDMPVYFTTMGLQDANGDPRSWESTLQQVLPAPPNRQTTGGSGGAGSQEGSQVVQSKVVTYTALFDVDNADGALMPQMTARVFFVSASASNALVVPLAALTPTGDRNVFKAWVVEDGDRRQRTVRLGVRDRLQAEVLSGLEDGDELVTSVRPAEETERLRW